MDSALKLIFDKQGLAIFVCYTCLDSKMFFSKNAKIFEKNIKNYLNDKKQCKMCLSDNYIFRDIFYNLFLI